MSHLSSTIGPNQLVSSVYLNMRVVRIRFTISEEGNRFKSDEVALQVQFSGEPALQFPAPHERRWCLQVVRFLTAAALLTDPFVGRSWSGLGLLTRVDLRTARSTPWSIRCRRVRDIKILQRHVHHIRCLEVVVTMAMILFLPCCRKNEHAGRSPEKLCPHYKKHNSS